MNWYRSSSTTIDQYSSKSLYGSLGTNTNTIDLREELSWFLHGTGIEPPRGHWVVLRKYDRTQTSDYYFKHTKEGVEGPAFEYTDTLLRTRRVPVTKRTEQLMPVKAGIDIENTFVYYFEYDVNPRRYDDIFEVSLEDHSLKPDINSLTYMEKYKIKNIHPYREINGRIEYWLTIGKRDEISY